LTDILSRGRKAVRIHLFSKSRDEHLQSGLVMDTARIAELLEPFLRAPIQLASEPCHSEPANAGEESAVLFPAQLQHISTYIDILLRWNARINLTAIRNPEDIVTRHFGESLFAARHLFPAERAVRNGRAIPGEGTTPSGRAAQGGGVAPGGGVVERTGVAAGERAALQGRVAGQGEGRALAPEGASQTTVGDIGSGAGFPGIPLKLWAPNISLTLIESNHKKAAFLHEIIRALTLTDINIQNSRAEALAGSVFDTVTLRAVERFEAILPTAASLVAPSGRLALLVGSAQQDRACSTLPHLSWSTHAHIPNSRSRLLLIGHKR
jgi:16S rRNA (guanine(527)-N(7))-methyltransferase RsmG